MVLAYVTNRAIMERLDSIVGPENWKNQYAPGPLGGVACGLSIRVGDEWITKWDGADNTQVESIKGGLSDAMKRAGVQWGIGRYLYNLTECFAECKAGKERGADWNYVPEDKKKGDPAFSWKTPTLPNWALPGNSTAHNTPPAAPVRHTRPKDNPLEKIDLISATDLSTVVDTAITVGELPEDWKEKVIEHYKVATFEDLNEKQYQNIIKSLKEKGIAVS
jgi:hypothetical protein